ncbi:MULTISPECIES: tyrosine-type recombinase/integrase [Shewanella]|uniref:Tyrosine-type recombinase/integrase n=1 Tax=Shewanella scandinavica TaxID=3063538 RepID=A0ABU3G4Q4_9GAMM|nr:MULTISPECIES: site-specific integrase [Shewanella]MDT3282620.1 tyrosine-type recombinase/integrase [Shewanella sp. SP2S1-2]TVL29262.1 integrase [Shewanella xiamenensis]UML94191.1 tyrosine-type recombinase/integrase [Shewanella xiamenensis]
MNDKQIKAFLKSKELGRKAIGDGLYLRVQTEGVAYWEVRYSVNGKRRSMMLDGGIYPAMPLVEAKAEAAKIKLLAKQGIDPLAERERQQEETIKTVNDLFDDWYQCTSSRLKHPEIPMRMYKKEIKPTIGQLKIVDVNARDIRAIIHKVAKSNRPTVANKTLLLCKQLFNHACKLDLVSGNPATAFKPVDAGGVEKSRDRALKISELVKLFEVLRNNSTVFTRDNYLALALLLTLGVRKGELISARWSDFDFERLEWRLPKGNTKTQVPITIPLPPQTITWFEELHSRAGGSKYVFPNRRASKRRGYISSDTLNHALSKMFGQKVDSNKQPLDNLLGQVGIEHFTIHDLRRTCRSLLAELKVLPHIAERCLNHKLKGIEAVYNKHDYLEERREALSLLAGLLSPIIDDTSNNITPFSRRA